MGEYLKISLYLVWKYAWIWCNRFAGIYNIQTNNSHLKKKPRDNQTCIWQKWPLSEINTFILINTYIICTTVGQHTSSVFNLEISQSGSYVPHKNLNWVTLKMVWVKLWYWNFEKLTSSKLSPAGTSKFLCFSQFWFVYSSTVFHAGRNFLIVLVGEFEAIGSWSSGGSLNIELTSPASPSLFSPSSWFSSTAVVSCGHPGLYTVVRWPRECACMWERAGVRRVTVCCSSHWP